MKLTVVGCSPAWPNPGGAHSGYVLEHAGRRLLVDCGPGVLSRLRAAESWPRVDAIAITHFHLDHCGDLVPWLWGHLMGPVAGTRGPALFIPPNGRADLNQLAERWDEAFDVQEYAEAETFDAAGFSITPRRVPHYSQPTWAMRIEAGGRAVVFSADSGPTDVLGELSKGADLFLCEATLGEDEHDREPRGHLSASEARAASRAQRLLLVHRAAELPPPDDVEVARDGLTIRL